MVVWEQPEGRDDSREEKQRAARKLREEKGEEWKPVWFHLNEDGDWVYKGGFWQAKQYDDFERCPDIF